MSAAQVRVAGGFAVHWDLTKGPTAKLGGGWALDVSRQSEKYRLQEPQAPVCSSVMRSFAALR